jgi:hypothetical protein
MGQGICLNDFFSFSKINGFEKAHEERSLRSLVHFTTIRGEGNDRPMCKLGV